MTRRLAFRRSCVPQEEERKALRANRFLSVDGIRVTVQTLVDMLKEPSAAQSGRVVRRLHEVETVAIK
ncbi:hypothetical protein F444_03093 [Phytophthora nicotianae P1976]|uniref:Uncharacterized protein n=1 Tax=Phytophthora nicotianae P1976 TaxID=1317066 RepID=A0A081AV91_PHYNI|nr:hypothetical protein F444_03093 [Phytophthora nicotianae P1976]